ncbi:MAG: YqgE/AlgH family protein [Mycobacteriales bacterium]
MTGESLGGRLLVAAPSLRGGIFERSVVFLLHHDADGAVGVILTHPGSQDVAAALPAWAGLAAPPCVVFVGGPVAGGTLLALARLQTAAGATVIGTVNLDCDPPAGEVVEARLFSGYAGWAAGQLELEIEAGGWFVVAAVADDPFSAEPERLWRSVLHRQSGPLALLATFPDDPLLN